MEASALRGGGAADPAAEGQLSLRAAAMADPMWRSVRSVGAQRGAVCEVRAISRTI